MTAKTTKLLFATLITCYSFFSFAQGSDKYSVSTEVEVDANTPSIKLLLADDDKQTSFDVFRKDFGSSVTWDTIKMGATGNNLTDTDVTLGFMYEYHIVKHRSDGINGHGYVTTGIEIEAGHHRGSLLLLIDSALYDSIQEELKTLRMDLVGDGYHLLEYVVPGSMDHIALKAEIAKVRAANDDLCDLYILGHVAVPYSGIYCEDNYWVVPPDGHKEGSGDHCGAWPADVYYAIIDGNWTDSYTVTDGTRSFTRNEPNDGKFDQIVLPGNVEYALGRVDLSNLPKFSKSEIQLTKQYLSKTHRYRHGESKPVMKALVDENFGANAQEAFGSAGYRSFGAMVGLDNINTNDYMSTLKDEQYLIAHGTGPGSFTSCGGVGTTDNFVNNQGAAYFNMLFGSFFGNWNVNNNFLRAPLAVENGGLTNAWSGRPNWHLYALALNKPIGYCTKTTQNNKDTYITPGFFANQIHVALMGDPTLRMNMYEGPTNLNATSESWNQRVKLSWTAPENDAVDGYNVYYSQDSMGPFVKANSELVTTTSYNMPSPLKGKVYFMVRAQRLETTHSGSFHNLSQGIFTSLDDLSTVGINAQLAKVDAFKVYPNPSNGLTYLNYTAEGNAVEFQLIDMKGAILKQEVLKGFGSQTHIVDLSDYPAGLYLIKVNNQSQRLILK